MSDDVASIGFKVNTSDIDKGSVALDNLASKGDAVDKAVSKVERATNSAAGFIGNLGSVSQKAASSFATIASYADQCGKSLFDFVNRTKSIATEQTELSRILSSSSANFTKSEEKELTALANKAQQLRMTAGEYQQYIMAQQGMGVAAQKIGGALADQIEKLKQSGEASSAASVGMKLLESAAYKVGAAFSVLKLADLVKDSAMLAARYETMGVVMQVAGNNAGYARSQIDRIENSLQKSGISMMESRNVITQLATAHIDLSKAAGLARASQDLAVVAGVNSSEALARVTQGIKSGHVQILQTLGLNVSFEKSYADLAKTLGKTTGQLTEHEKVQARTNAVTEEAKAYADLYEAAMGTAGKQITSLTRYWNDFKVTAGDMFLPALTEGVKALSIALKDAKNVLSSLGIGQSSEFVQVNKLVAEREELKAKIKKSDNGNWLTGLFDANSAGNVGSNLYRGTQNRIDEINKKIGEIQDAEKNNQLKAMQAKDKIKLREDAAASAKAASELSDIALSYASKDLKTALEIKKVNEKWIEATQGKNVSLDQIAQATKDRDKALAGIIEKSKENQKKGILIDGAQTKFDLQSIKNAAAQQIDVLKNTQAMSDAMHSAGLISDRDYYEQKKNIIESNTNVQIYALEKENERLAQQKLNAKESINADKEIAKNNAEIAKLSADASTKIQVLNIQETRAIENKRNAIEAATKAQEDYLNVTSKQYARQLASIGLGSDRRNYNSAINQIEDKYSDQRLRLQRDRNLAATDDARDQLDKQIADIDNFQNLALQSYQSYWENLKAGERDWTIGAKDSIADYFASSQNMAEQTKNLFSNAFKGMEDALVSFVMTGKADFKSLANSIIADLIRIQARAAISGMFSSVMGLFGGGSTPGAGFVADPTAVAGADYLAAVMHTGGIVGGDAATRSVDLSVFSGAPRFHTGGIVSGEVPIIAKEDEGVFTPGQMAALAPVGSIAGIVSSELERISSLSKQPLMIGSTGGMVQPLHSATDVSAAQATALAPVVSELERIASISKQSLSLMVESAGGITSLASSAGSQPAWNPDKIASGSDVVRPPYKTPTMNQGQMAALAPGGSGGGNITVTVPVSVATAGGGHGNSGSPQESALAQIGETLSKQIEPLVKKTISQEMRPRGLLWDWANRRA